MRRFLVFAIFLVITTNVGAQSLAWVIFTDKKDVCYDGSIANPDFYDLPLHADYVDAVRPHSQKILGESRWNNAIAVKATPAQLIKIRQLSCVEKVQLFDKKEIITTFKTKAKKNRKKELLTLAQHQTARLGMAYFQEAGFTGKNIRIAVIDGGFPRVDTHSAFRHVRPNIVKTYDFTKNRAPVWSGVSHGTEVLSNIAGFSDSLNVPLGLAPDAEFLLAITEVRGEPFSEEISWTRAVEWAYDNGAKIVSSSLGYHKQRYFPEDMNGEISMVARTARIAARKGMIIVNAAGNEGVARWKKIITPADADSVLAVGGIDPKTELHIDFSSYGPSTDGRVKPDICADGTTVVARPNKGYMRVSGTSFATPLITGFVACAWQAQPQLSNIELMDAIRASGELYPYFDYAHGYGVPNAAYFTGKKPETQKSFDFVDTGDTIKIVIKEAHRELLGKSNIYRLFYHFENNRKQLTDYVVIDVFQPVALCFTKQDLRTTKYLRVHFLGYTETYEIQ